MGFMEDANFCRKCGRKREYASRSPIGSPRLATTEHQRPCEFQKHADEYIPLPGGPSSNGRRKETDILRRENAKLNSMLREALQARRQTERDRAMDLKMYNEGMDAMHRKIQALDKQVL